MRFSVKSLVLIFLLLWQLPAFSGSGKIEFVECSVDLQDDGTCVIGYTVRYRVVSGELHGFYFDSQDELHIHAFSDKSYGVDST